MHMQLKQYIALLAEFVTNEDHDYTECIVTLGCGPHDVITYRSCLDNNNNLY